MTRPISEQVHLVTGGTNGIVKSAAAALARLGARVVITGRDDAKARTVVDELKRDTGRDAIESIHVDFASLASVRTFLEEARARFPRIDVLVNNAGAMFTTRRETVDGHEQTLQTNHLSMFMTTLGLLPSLEAVGQARVVCVSSGAHQGGTLRFDDLEMRQGWSSFGAYSATKLMNILFVREAARRLPSSITIHAMHPGAVATGFGRNDSAALAFAMRLAAPFMKTPEQGADTIVWLATSEDVRGKTGGYWARRKPGRMSRAAQDDVAARRLWDETERMTAMTLAASPRERVA